MDCLSRPSLARAIRRRQRSEERQAPVRPKPPEAQTPNYGARGATLAIPYSHDKAGRCAIRAAKCVCSWKQGRKILGNGMTEGSCQPSAVSHQQSTSSTWRRRDGGETGTNAMAGPRVRGSPPGARGVNEIAANYCEILLTG